METEVLILKWESCGGWKVVTPIFVAGENAIVSVPGIGGSLAVVAAMHSRTHCFEVKLMDLEPHDPYAKTAKRVAVLAEEQRKTAKKEKLDNKRQHTQDVAGPSSYSSQPRSKRSNIRKRSVDTSSSHTISEVHNSANEGRKICISEGGGKKVTK
ncbi:hypothetical protein Tco_0051945 [Tanacetum coccineum]